jgi:hypothetical protein
MFFIVNKALKLLGAYALRRGNPRPQVIIMSVSIIQMNNLKAPHFIKKLMKNDALAGYQSPKSGRITYNKVASKDSFAAFSDIILSIVPLDLVNDPDKNHKLPSIAKALPEKKKSVNVYSHYLVLNATMDEYMDYEDEEDLENLEALFDEILEIKTPTVGIAIQKSEAMGSAHAVAFIAWKHPKHPKHPKLKLAFYDPLAYKRGTRSYYDFTSRAFAKERFGNKYEFINLNDYCYKPDKSSDDFHCSQYIMNAEYCYIYAAYFLSQWIKFGAKIHRASFRKAITSTYIVHPSKLTRANTKESMIYRVVMMQFMCQVFLKYLKGLTKTQKKYIKDSRKHIGRINAYLDEFKTVYGFDLLTNT